jgi:hypothetical protein
MEKSKRAVGVADVSRLVSSCSRGSSTSECSVLDPARRRLAKPRLQDISNCMIAVVKDMSRVVAASREFIVVREAKRRVLQGDSNARAVVGQCWQEEFIGKLTSTREDEHRQTNSGYHYRTTSHNRDTRLDDIYRDVRHTLQGYIASTRPVCPHCAS